MIIRKDIDLNTPLTTAQAEMLEALADRPVTPDEDCPELTPAQIAQFKQIAAANREDRCKQTVTLRLSPSPGVSVIVLAASWESEDTSSVSSSVKA